MNIDYFYYKESYSIAHLFSTAEFGPVFIPYSNIFFKAILSSVVTLSI